MTDIRTTQAFMSKMRGIPANVVAIAMSRLSHSTDYTRCSKTMMAQSWASGRLMDDLDIIYARSMEVLNSRADQRIRRAETLKNWEKAREARKAEKAADDALLCEVFDWALSVCDYSRQAAIKKLRFKLRIDG